MNSTKKNIMQEPLDIPENQIPWYRWRWVYMLAFFLCFPAMLLISLTGNVYGKDDGVIFKLSNKFKNLILIGGLFLTVNVLLRFLG